MNPELKAYLVANHGLSAGADESAARDLAAKLLASGDLKADKYLELITPKAADPMARLAETIAKSVSESVGAAVKPIENRLAEVERQAAAASHDDAVKSLASQIAAGRTVTPDSAVTPDQLLSANAKATHAGGGRVDVKPASAGYSSVKSAAVWTKGANRGNPIVMEGKTLHHASDLDMAYGGAVMGWVIAKQLGRASLVRDHHRQLLEEALRKCRFSGDIETKDGVFELQKDFLSEAMIKTILDDSTSGGQNLIVDEVEDMIIVAPLLHSEIFPLCTLRTIPKGSGIVTATLANLTMAFAASEATALVQETTTSLITAVTSAVRPITGAVNIGRDFMADAPTTLMARIAESYQQRLLRQLDDQAINGDGTTEPLGIVNTSGTNAVSNASPSPTGWDVVDVENLVKGVPKQYRRKGNPSIAWAMTDTSYFRIRGLQVSTTDQRRIFGMDHQGYMIFDAPVKIESSMGNAKVIFGDFSKYVYWRRLGLETRTTDQGQTLSLANELLVTVRSRWAGRPTEPAAFSYMSTAPA